MKPRNPTDTELTRQLIRTKLNIIEIRTKNIDSLKERIESHKRSIKNYEDQNKADSKEIKRLEASLNGGAE